MVLENFVFLPLFSFHSSEYPFYVKDDGVHRMVNMFLENVYKMNGTKTLLLRNKFLTSNLIRFCVYENGIRCVRIASSKTTDILHLPTTHRFL